MIFFHVYQTCPRFLSGFWSEVVFRGEVVFWSEALFWSEEKSEEKSFRNPPSRERVKNGASGIVSPEHWTEDLE